MAIKPESGVIQIYKPGQVLASAAECLDLVVQWYLRGSVLSQGEAGIDSIIRAPSRCLLRVHIRVLDAVGSSFFFFNFSFGISTICYFGIYQ